MVIKATIIKVLFAEMYVHVVFVIRCLYSAVSLTLVKGQRFIIIIYHYYYYHCLRLVSTDEKCPLTDPKHPACMTIRHIQDDEKMGFEDTGD